MMEILFSGCRSGKFPLEYARAHHSDKVTVHAYDAYQARKIREDVGPKTNVTVLCAEHLPDGASYAHAYYYATSKLVSAELELDTLQDIYLHLDEGARLVTEGVAPETLGKLFAKVDLKNPRKQDVIAQLFEVVSYDASDRYVAELKAVAAPWLAEIAKWDKATAEQRKGELFHVRNAANVLYRNKVIDDNCTIRNGVMAVINKYGLK